MRSEKQAAYILAACCEDHEDWDLQDLELDEPAVLISRIDDLEKHKNVDGTISRGLLDVIGVITV